MEKFIINGGRKLEGKVEIESAKNAVLPIMAGAILTDEEVIIKKCPKIQDVFNMIKILKSLGVNVYWQENNLVINASTINKAEISKGLTETLRSSIFMLGGLLTRFKYAKISFPGGCRIGKRPIDIHIEGLKKLGVKVEETEDSLYCKVNEIKCEKVYLRYASVGATINLIFASIFNSGSIELINVAREPEIVNLVEFLNTLGAKIYGAGTSKIVVVGVKKLHGATFTPMFDRIEADTFIFATVITGGKLEIYNSNCKNIYSLSNKFFNNTCKVVYKNGIISIRVESGFSGIKISTGPYPQFPTDLQSQLTALCSVAKGNSIIEETVFENRFAYVNELKKLGANIVVKNNTAFVTGVKRLYGGVVTATDLRGGASLILAGLVAEGQTEINDILHIERGYANIENKLSMLGANIKKEILLKNEN